MCIECQCKIDCDVLTSMVFQSKSSTFFMGKCGAFMLQNLVTIVKRSRAKGSPLYRGEPRKLKVNINIYLGIWIKKKKSEDTASCNCDILNDPPSSFLKVSLATVHSGLSSSV